MENNCVFKLVAKDNGDTIDMKQKNMILLYELLLGQKLFRDDKCKDVKKYVYYKSQIQPLEKLITSTDFNNLNDIMSFVYKLNNTLKQILRSGKEINKSVYNKMAQKEIHIENCLAISLEMGIPEDIIKFIILHDICSGLVSDRMPDHIKKKLNKKYGRANHASASAFVCSILLSNVNNCKEYCELVANHQTHKGGIIYLVDKTEKISTKNIARKMKAKEKDKLIEKYRDECTKLIKNNEWFSLSSFIKEDVCKVITKNKNHFKVTRVGKSIYVHKSNENGIISDPCNEKAVYVQTFRHKLIAKKYFNNMTTIDSYFIEEQTKKKK